MERNERTAHVLGRNAKPLARRALCALLSVALALFAIPPASAYADSETPYLGEGNVVVSTASVSIDDATLSRAQFASAMASVKRLPNTPATCATSEYADLVAMSASQAGTLQQLGSALHIPFMRVKIAICIASILAFGGPAVFKIPAGAIEGVKRDILVAISSPAGSVIIDGVPVGTSWLTVDSTSCISENYESIEVVEPGTTVPAGTLTDEQQAITASLDKTFKNYLDNEQNSENRSNCSVVVVGCNKRTGEFAIGIKMSREDKALKETLEALPGTATLPADIYPGLKVSVVVGDYWCAEDACVGALGGADLSKGKGADGKVAVISEELEHIVMIQPFRPRTGKPVPVCDYCKANYGPQRFVAGVDLG